jgi:hypothetical protein
MKRIKFKLSEIRKNEKYRPAGYYDDVVSSGIIVGDCVEMDFQTAIALREKYGERNPALGLNDAIEWGPILWKEFHNRTKQYKMDVEAENRWLTIFGSWIPCGECRSHYLELLKKTPPDLHSKESFEEWGIDIHNKVNIRLGKPIFHLLH